MSGDPAVEESLADVAADFLGADQVNVQLGVVRRRAEAAGGHVNLIASLRKQLDGRAFEASFRNGDFEGA